MARTSPPSDFYLRIVNWNKRVNLTLNNQSCHWDGTLSFPLIFITANLLEWIPVTSLKMSSLLFLFPLTIETRTINKKRAMNSLLPPKFWCMGLRAWNLENPSYPIFKLLVNPKLVILQRLTKWGSTLGVCLRCGGSHLCFCQCTWSPLVRCGPRWRTTFWKSENLSFSFNY